MLFCSIGGGGEGGISLNPINLNDSFHCFVRYHWATRTAREQAKRGVHIGSVTLPHQLGRKVGATTELGTGGAKFNPSKNRHGAQAVNVLVASREKESRNYYPNTHI